MLKNNIKFRRLPKISKVTVYTPKPSRRLKVQWFGELEGQSYPVLKFEVEIHTLMKVGGCKLYFIL